MGFEPLLTVPNPPTSTYTDTVSSTSNHWQGRSPNLRRPRDQVMLRKRISGNWILLAQAQEFSLQWSWVWCARNASSIGRRGIHRGEVQRSGGQGGNGGSFGGSRFFSTVPCLISPHLWFYSCLPVGFVKKNLHPDSMLGREYCLISHHVPKNGTWVNAITIHIQLEIVN